MVFWTFGDLGRIGWGELYMVAVVSLGIVIPYFPYRSIDYDLMLSSDEPTKSTGISPERIRLETTIIATFGTAIATSFVGIICFVCLMAPHAARLIVGGGHKYIMPTSMLTGLIILIISDTIRRTVIAPKIIPVGIMTFMVGAPLLVYLLIKGGKYGHRD